MEPAPVPPAQPDQVSLEILKQFNEAFGQRSTEFILAGLSFEQARQRFIDLRLSALEIENKQLKEAIENADAEAKKFAELFEQISEKFLIKGWAGSPESKPALEVDPANTESNCD